MRRDEALAQVPLLVAGDLEPAEAAAVEAALAGDPEAEALQAEHAAVHAALERALAPATDEEPAWLEALARAEPDEPAEADALEGVAPAAASAPLVSRRCPYCRDALTGAAVVFCADCATPHHAACFGENAGCSLLGCGGVRAVAAGAAPTARVCPACAGATPADAPFCAWCGASASPLASPRHQRRRLAPPQRWPRYVAAAAVLALTSLGAGALFGALQAETLEGALAERVRRALRAAERDAPLLLRRIAAAQHAFREQDLDRDQTRDFAEDLAALARADPELARALGERFGPLLRRYDVRVGARRPPGAAFWALALPRQDWPPTGFFINHRGGFRQFRAPRFEGGGPIVDPERGELVGADWEVVPHGGSRDVR